MYGFWIVAVLGCRPAGDGADEVSWALQTESQDTAGVVTTSGTSSVTSPSSTRTESEDTSSTPGPGTSTTPTTDGWPTIEVVGRELRVNGAPFHIKGVNWNPTPIGLWNEPDFTGTVEEDAALMAEAGINVVRTYQAITDHGVLDTLWGHGIYVINDVYGYGGDPVERAVERVQAVKGHPAILMWSVGNEWNYNNLYMYGSWSWSDTLDRVEEVAQLVKAEDATRPVASIYGEGMDASTLSRLDEVDIWGLNIYRFDGFYGLFEEWSSLTETAMFVAEYGADAYNAVEGAEDQASQAIGTERLTQEILDASIRGGSGVCSGGVIFEFSDEWWKDDGGAWDVQDVGGLAPGGGPFPDAVFNEEWWGLVDIERNPREAFTTYAGMPVP